MEITIKGKCFSFHKNFIIFIFGILTQITYIVYSSIFYKLGFPLDDAWIHQTYARNLLRFGDWVFNPGLRSAGSTSPLWTILLIPGHLFSNYFFLFWTIIISSGLFITSAIIFQNILEKLIQTKTKFPFGGLLFLFEWHIAWAANSGMETILFIFFILAFIYYLYSEKNLIHLWIILGLIIFIRPDGITLMGPLFFVLIMDNNMRQPKKIKDHIVGIVIFLCMLLLFSIFNYRLSGQFLPNTFFAKQAEYQILLLRPLGVRVIELLIIPLTGVGILLVPGFLVFMYQSIIEKNWKNITLFLWFFGYILMYAIRLPVNYQHGRYLIPTIPVFILISCIGTIKLFNNQSLNFKLFKLGYSLTIISVLIIFFTLGAKAYAEDVAIIETEMVETAIWINNNLDDGAIIAAHDIGALGYFGNRKIIDLAGLISSDVIPIIRDEPGLEMYLNQNNADYLVVFPGWYEQLDNLKAVIYQSTGLFSPKAGGENMHIYSWR